MTPGENDKILSGEIWDEFSDRVQQLKTIVWNDDVPNDPLVRAEGARYLLRFLTAGLRVCMELDDADHPLIDYNIYNRMSWGLDNPDCNYSFARLDPKNSYRIRGTLGSAKNIEFQVTSGHHADGKFMEWQSVSALRGSDIQANPDGSFELLLGPKQVSGNWMLLNETAGFLLVREFFDDWGNQQRAKLLMEVVDAKYPPEPLSTYQIASHFELLNQWLDTGAKCWDEFAKGILANAPGDIEPFLPPAGAAALGGQAYGMGSFALEEDEAIVLECDPPACLVWGFSLCDRFFQSVECEHRQSSLNSHQAVMHESEGRSIFVAVIALADPGVANWLDCGGHKEGIIAIRYVLTEEVPKVRYTKIKLAELDTYLPTGVARVHPAERSEIIRERRLAYHQRMKS